MRVSKRDFLKSLGIAGTLTSLSGRYPSPAQAARAAVPIAIEPTLTDAPKTLGLPLGALPDYLEAIDDILYDRIVFGPGSSLPQHIAMFSVPFGQMCPYMGVLKDFSHTNSMCAQCIPAPQSFWIRRIHVAVNPDVAPEDFRIARNCSWELFLGQKTWAQGPLASDAQKRSLAELLRGKAPAVRVSMEFANTKGLYVPMLHSYYASITTPQLVCRGLLDIVSREGNGLEFMITLEGVRWRSVA